MGLFKRLMTSLMAKASPHMRELGIELEQAEAGVAIGVVPYREDLVGDPTTGVLHGGVVTTLLDSTAGAAVFSALRGPIPIPIATLDLRIDYLRPSTPHAPLYARVECYKLTHHVAFARGIAYNLDASDPVASMSATFMLRTQALPHPKPGGS
jgi:uncharacterized protein (TIGR00369 family)